MISRIFENFFFQNKIVKKEKIGLEIISSMKKYFVCRTCEYVLLSVAFLRSVTIVWHESRRYHVSNHLMRHVTRGERVFQIIITSVRIIISHLYFCDDDHCCCCTFMIPFCKFYDETQTTNNRCNVCILNENFPLLSIFQQQLQRFHF